MSRQTNFCSLNSRGEEFIRENAVSSGPYEFLALREENDEPILKSLWCDDEIIEIMGE